MPDFDAKDNFNPDELNAFGDAGARDITAPAPEKKAQKKKPTDGIVTEIVVDEPDYELRLNPKGIALGGVKVGEYEYSEFRTFYSDVNFDQLGERVQDMAKRAVVHSAITTFPEFNAGTSKVFITVKVVA
jgi:hypothetical protein